MLSIFRFGFGLLALGAMAWQLRLHIQASYSVLNFFSYFTNLSNLLAALVLLAGAFRPKARPGAWHDLVRAASVINMAVVGLVFAALLRHVDLGGLLPWVNFVLHYVMPCVVVLDWLVAPPRQRLGARHLPLLLVFPLVYLVYVVVRGAATGWYPYPFFNPANVGGYGGVAAYAIGITATFLLAAVLLMAAGNRLRFARG